MEDAINEDSNNCGVFWISQVELHTSTAHWDVSRVKFRRGSGDVGRNYTWEGNKIKELIKDRLENYMW